jgi:hypothetical protein
MCSSGFMAAAHGVRWSRSGDTLSADIGIDLLQKRTTCYRLRYDNVTRCVHFGGMESARRTGGVNEAQFAAH